MLAWLDGQLLESPEQPAIGVLDHGIIVGDGVFETIKIEDGSPFALTLFSTASCGRLRVSESANRMSPRSEGRRRDDGGAGPAVRPIRVTVTSGPGPLGSPRGDHALTSVVITEPCDRPPSIRSIITVPWPRNERGALAGLKTTSYAENAKMVEAAMAKGASESVMPTTGCSPRAPAPTSCTSSASS